MRIRPLVLCVGLLALAGPTQAAVKYIHATAGNIDIVSAMSEARTKRFLHELVGIRLLIEDLLGAPVVQNSTQVIVFGSPREMTDFYQAPDSASFYRLTWYCTTSDFGDTFSIVNDWPNDKRYRQEALHTYASWLINRTFRSCPYWINHGLSQLLSTLEYHDGTLRLGATAIEPKGDWRPSYSPTPLPSKVPKRIPLADTLNQEWGSKDTFGLWRMWLTEDYDGNREKIRWLADLIRRGAPGNADTVSQVFGQPIAEIQTALYKHMRKLGDVTVDRPSITNPVLADVAFSSATPYDEGIAKGMVLSTITGRPATVMKDLQALFTTHAGSPRPAEAIARLAMADHKPDVAENFWLMAAAKGTGNSYGYVVVLRKVIEPRISRIDLQPSLLPDRAADLRQLVDRCVAIDPGRYEALVWSAWLEALAPDPQVERLDRVLQSQTRFLQPNAFLALAVANIRLKRFTEAAALLDEYEKLFGNNRAYNTNLVDFLRKKIP